MSTRIVIVAHAPLASALQQCALHVFGEQAQELVAVDVMAQASVEDSVGVASQALPGGASDDLLVLTDALGATPCNVAGRLLQGRKGQLLAGVNLPMLLRAVTYRHEPLERLAELALQGGLQGVLRVDGQ